MVIGKLEISFPTLIFSAVLSVYFFILGPTLALETGSLFQRSIEITEDGLNAVDEVVSPNTEKKEAVISYAPYSFELTPYKTTAFTKKDAASIAKVKNKRPVVLVDEMKTEVIKQRVEQRVEQRIEKISLNTRDVATHYGHQVELPQIESAVAILRRVNVEKRLMALRELDRSEGIAILTEGAKKNNRDIEDKVREKIAAVERKQNDDIDEDDFVVFDYSHNEEEITASNSQTMNPQDEYSNSGVEGAIPASIQNALAMSDRQRTQQLAVKTSQTVGAPIASVNKVEVIDNLEDEIITHAARNESGSSSSGPTDAIVSAMEEARKTGPTNGRLTIRPLEVVLGGDVSTQGARVESFEFIPDYDKGEYLYDEKGNLSVSYNLNSQKGLLRGSIIKRGYVPTKVDLLLERGNFVRPIPFITEDSLRAILKERGGLNYGGHLLVEVDETVSFFTLDNRFSTKVYLDEHFQEINEVDIPRFVLVLNVAPGNILVSYHTHEEEIIDQVVHVVEDELLFIEGILTGSVRKNIELYERNIMSQRLQPLQIPEANIKYFNQNISSRQITLNTYQIVLPTRPLNMRNYLEINSFGSVMMLGLGETSKVVLPAENFTNKILEKFGLNNIRRRCIVQLNFSKEVVKMNFSGESRNGLLYTEEFYLDEDGVIAEYSSDLTTNAFIMGDEQGVLNFKVKYKDLSTDFIQSYCSPGTYLVEQL